MDRLRNLRTRRDSASSTPHATLAEVTLSDETQWAAKLDHWAEKDFDDKDEEVEAFAAELEETMSRAGSDWTNLAWRGDTQSEFDEREYEIRHVSGFTFARPRVLMDRARMSARAAKESARENRAKASAFVDRRVQKAAAARGELRERREHALAVIKAAAREKKSKLSHRAATVKAAAAGTARGVAGTARDKAVAARGAMAERRDAVGERRKKAADVVAKNLVRWRARRAERRSRADKGGAGGSGGGGFGRRSREAKSRGADTGASASRSPPLAPSPEAATVSASAPASPVLLSTTTSGAPPAAPAPSPVKRVIPVTDVELLPDSAREDSTNRSSTDDEARRSDLADLPSAGAEEEESEESSIESSWRVVEAVAARVVSAGAGVMTQAANTLAPSKSSAPGSSRGAADGAIGGGGSTADGGSGGGSSRGGGGGRGAGHDFPPDFVPAGVAPNSASASPPMDVTDAASALAPTDAGPPDDCNAIGDSSGHAVRKSKSPLLPPERWEQPADAPLVRGPNYFEDGKKINAQGGPICSLFAVQTFELKGEHLAGGEDQDPLPTLSYPP